MKTERFFILFLFSFLLSPCTAQVPQGFNYQAIARNSNGVPITSQTIPVRVSVVTALTGGTILWQEEHSSVAADQFGMITLVVGAGTKTTGTASSFSAIDWSAQTLFLKTEVKYPGPGWTDMGTSQIWAVPYSLMAKSIAPLSKLGITGTTDALDSALFEVKNKSGQTVFAVYNEGVRIYVSDKSKGSKGGFSIGGFETDKSTSQNLLVVSPDSIRAYVDSNSGKGTKGGFAVGGFDMTKGGKDEYLRITRDSTRVYINDTETKGTKGGFAVGGFDMAKGTKDEYLRITRDSTRVYLNNTATKGTKGGFAVGGFDMAKGTENNYMLVSPDSTMVYVRSLGPDSSSTFNIVATNLVQERKYLLQANTDTIGISGVLNVHNNVLVTGNINLSGSTVQDTSHVTDLDGNTYKTIRIGTQIWMAEDLKTTKFNDGTAILNVVDPGLWSSYSPAYCWYNNAATYKSTYGALYNWFAASAGNLCPIGWRVPFNDDWMTLSNYLGEGGGGMIKETGTSHWTSPNEGATNETGFTALPGGSRTVDGLFDGMGLYENWWTSTSGDGTGGYWSVSYDSNGIMSDFNNWYIGSAVRCIYGQY